MTATVSHSPVVVHDSYEQADLVDVLRRDVEHDSFVVDGVQRVPLGGGLPLLQPAALAHQRDLHVWVWGDKERETFM